jgi:S1-C subfamily serine protease
VFVAQLQRLPRSLVSLLWLVAAAASISSGYLRAHDFANSLVKVRAVAADGSQSFGSGVVIAADLLATTCHVAREAKIIEVAHGAEHWVATVESGSLTHDLCLIRVPNLDLPAVAIRASESLRPGEHVVAVGFPGGGDLTVRQGVVEGLYRYDGGQVIRTSATFDAGASGGGLFDEEGALVGLLAFKARSGAKLHFALPADWALPGTMVSSLLGPVATSSERSAFWERPRASQPAFLGHAILEAASQR